ncbi:nucleolar protein 8 [Parambassis ranga]|uniref:Nucleolar protein 8 n=1 Tax=Parambassis ranga TaxID=210632 RepID=A0A6P7IDU8_9TELE|nr:nucleolar protein 8 [Parambassis ranga]
MRRLYVGGLSHTVTQKDLKDRFGKFGDVEDVEIRTRRDNDGVPYKTFGYININISDGDLKKCLTVLNKSKWKGGTLQIETAKESFLHKLAQERQAAAEQHLQQPAAEDMRRKVLDSLSKAGVDNFTMKAAVPGTEIPGHKDWVVSKFGRVLPVLQLRCLKGSKSRTLKYDPSKYSHNIRKLDRQTADESTPVTQLTWELDGGDDDISKKRRGEFPHYEPPKPKKSRTDAVTSHNSVGTTRFEQTVNSVNHTESRRLTNGFEQPANHRPAQQKWTHFYDSDDSEDEIRRLVASQETSHGRLHPDVEEDELEVVGHDYLIKSGQKGDEEEDDYDSADTDEIFASRKPQLPDKHIPPTAEHLSENKMGIKRTKSNVGEKEEEEAAPKEHIRKPSSTQKKGDSSKEKNKKTAVLPVITLSSLESDDDDDDEADDDDDDDEDDSSDSCSDSDYEAMFSNVTHLEISLADLQRVAEEVQQASKTSVPSIPSSDFEPETNFISSPAERHVPKKDTLPEEILAAIMEEDSSEDEQKKKKKKKRKGALSAPLPAFQGTKALNEILEKEERKTEVEVEEEEEAEGGREVKKLKLNLRTADNKTSMSVSRQNKTSECSEEEEDEDEDKEKNEKEGEAKENMAAPKTLKMEDETASSSSSGDDEEEGDEEEEDNTEEKTVTEKKRELVPNKVSEKTVTDSSSDDDDDAEEGEEMMNISQTVCTAKSAAKTLPSSFKEEKEEQAPPRVALGAEEEEERQRVTNMRRLAAVQQRQKEAEEHKKLIKGALANLDAPAAGAGKHIIFGSDDEDDEDEQQTVTTSTKSLFQDSQSEDEATGDEATNQSSTIKEKASAHQLFSGSEDEDGDEDKDGSRFKIRPQFEGRAGQKLMELQSRFGTDERFRMDSRFLEDMEEDKKQKDESVMQKNLTEDDDALEEERKKNLSILQNVLGSNQQTCSTKPAVKAKKFRDVSALHYDPSREEHTAFETKTDDNKKESKAARKKKREEALKLPEVSKDIYYDVSGDLKAVFGQTKDDITKADEKLANWDQEEEREEENIEDEELNPLSSLLSADPSTEKEDSSGFKFSFFGDDTEAAGSGETAEYKVESIQAPKVFWQQDPRFQDSSSEEEEEEEELKEQEEQSSAGAKTTEEETPSNTDLFFFYPDDNRLTEGPKMFCRMSQLEEQREEWEERRSALRQEYRKKHKDARRKITSSVKS